MHDQRSPQEVLRWARAALAPGGMFGAGLGVMRGAELAGQMLAGAGFAQVDLLDSPRPQNCICACRT